VNNTSNKLYGQGQEKHYLIYYDQLQSTKYLRLRLFSLWPLS